MPCQEWFMEQDPAYRQLVLPPDVKVRASIEAAVTMGWRDFVGDHGEMLGLNHYGASAPAAILFEQFGITADRLVAAVHSSLSKVGGTKGQHDRQLSTHVDDRPRNQTMQARSKAWHR